MQCMVKTFEELTCKELYEILKARAAVFVVEQNCVYQDLDCRDYDSYHIFYEENGEVLAYLRIFHKDKTQHLVQIGRVLTTRRNAGLGKKIMREGIRAAEEKMSADKIYIEAQCYAIGFYEKAGFQVTSEEFLEDGIPHVQMMRERQHGHY